MIIQQLFLHTLGHLHGYLGSSPQDLKWPRVEVTVLHHFSARARVTARQVEEAVAAASRRPCPESRRAGSPAPCALQRALGTYQGLSLCQFNICDSVSTSCAFQDGLVQCACQPGYLQAQATDRTCTACGSGFWLRNGTCARCSFGFSGAGCQEPFLLALVVVSCLAAGLLLLLLLLLLSSTASLARAQAPEEPPGPPRLPLHSPTLSLPRVRPPWTLPEVESGGGPPSSPWDLDLGPRPADAPHMKTFRGPASSLPSAPQPLGGCSNLVFLSDAEEEEGSKRSYF